MREHMRARSIARMDEIVRYFAQVAGVLAVVAFGSNAQRERFDDFSDLDFLVLVEPQAKAGVLTSVSGLQSVCAIDGLRIFDGDAIQLLFTDGVMCDFGIASPEQLSTFQHGAGKYLWRRAGWTAVELSANEPNRMTADELVKDALFHLYVGVLRILRGEQAAAFYEIQVEAAQRVLSFLQDEDADAFSPLRRAECLTDTQILKNLMPGYAHSREAVQAALKYLVSEKDTPLYQAVSALLHG